MPATAGNYFSGGLQAPVVFSGRKQRSKQCEASEDYRVAKWQKLRRAVTNNQTAAEATA
jgi:hypothetical protein